MSAVVKFPQRRRLFLRRRLALLARVWILWFRLKILEWRFRWEARALRRDLHADC